MLISQAYCGADLIRGKHNYSGALLTFCCFANFYGGVKIIMLRKIQKQTNKNLLFHVESN